MDFEQIVLKYQNLVYTVCFNILKNPQDAENTAQETFLSAYLNLKQQSGDINEFDGMKSWLCKIAANKSIDFKRKNAKNVYAELTDGIPEIPQNQPEIQFEQKERSERLNKVISNIPEKYANAIKAFYFNQMSVKEIAKYYGIPEKTVETHLYRAKKLIKERWGENETGY